MNDFLKIPPPNLKPACTWPFGVDHKFMLLQKKEKKQKTDASKKIEALL